MWRNASDFHHRFHILHDSLVYIVQAQPLQWQSSAAQNGGKQKQNVEIKNTWVQVNYLRLVFFTLVHTLHLQQVLGHAHTRQPWQHSEMTRQAELCGGPTGIMSKLDWNQTQTHGSIVEILWLHDDSPTQTERERHDSFQKLTLNSLFSKYVI